jgi:two-component system OmpR family response regulator
MKVYVVEDSPFIQERLVAMLREIPGVDVVGVADSSTEALAGIAHHQPDVAVVDLRLRTGNGIEVMQGIRRHSADTTVMVLTNYANVIVRRRCEDVGADYFFDKTTEFEQLGSEIERLSGQPEYYRPAP